MWKERIPVWRKLSTFLCSAIVGKKKSSLMRNKHTQLKNENDRLRKERGCWIDGWVLHVLWARGEKEGEKRLNFNFLSSPFSSSSFLGVTIRFPLELMRRSKRRKRKCKEEANPQLFFWVPQLFDQPVFHGKVQK